MTANTQDWLTSSTSLNDSTGVVTLREDPTLELDRVFVYGSLLLAPLRSTEIFSTL